MPTFPAGASFPHSGYVSVRCVGCSGGYILNRRGNQAAVAGSVTDSITAKAPDQRRDCRINAHPPDEIAVFLLLFCCFISESTIFFFNVLKNKALKSSLFHFNLICDLISIATATVSKVEIHRDLIYPWVVG